MTRFGIRACPCREQGRREFNLLRSTHHVSPGEPPASLAEDASYVAKGEEISRVDAPVTPSAQESVVRLAVQSSLLATQLAGNRGPRTRGGAPLERDLRSSPAHF